MNGEVEDFIPLFSKKTFDQIYQLLTPTLTNLDFIKNCKGDLVKGDNTLRLIASEISVFCFYGPGQGELAWAEQIANARHELEGGKA